MKKLTQEDIKQFATDFETAFFEGDEHRRIDCEFELREEVEVISPNPKMIIDTYVIVTTEKNYKYCYFEVVLFFKLIFKKEINGEMKDIYIKCNYPLIIHTRGSFDYENYYLTRTPALKRHSLYPNMKILSNYMIPKMISIIIEKGKAIDILITEEELLPIFDDDTRKDILKQTTFVVGANYHSL